ncbi:DUF2512 family protein [Alteribacillus iranensis]|uniref:4 TMS phage holin, superfamily IV n=1 Tax=Alteribacillus iranensis TaxID=930128 RepID=A0A1I2E4B0_9BACI|nr:DUF2512 family protein [Alteribacillus iranensis]SFE87341.1 Protein of unknown function [Alteribacillus iranensis]
MEHVKALTFKGLLTLAVLWLILTVGFGVSFWHVIILTVILGVLSYPGDVFLLPKIDNLPATAGDFVLSFLVIWLYGTLFFTADISVWLASLISALFLAGGEYYYHTYLATHLLPANNRLRMDSQ